MKKSWRLVPWTPSLSQVNLARSYNTENLRVYILSFSLLKEGKTASQVNYYESLQKRSDCRGKSQERP